MLTDAMTNIFGQYHDRDEKQAIGYRKVNENLVDAKNQSPQHLGESLVHRNPQGVFRVVRQFCLDISRLSTQTEI